MTAGFERSTGAGRRGAAAVFAALLAIYALSPVENVGDARYTILLAQHLLRHGDVALERYFQPPLDPQRTPGVIAWRSDPPRRAGTPYQLEWNGERATLLYPHGTALLSLPAIALLGATGESAIAADGGYDRAGEERMQRILAAPLAAAIGALWFAIARRRGLGRAASLALALGVGLATPIWSTASRALWNHGWSVLVVSLAAAELVAAADARRTPRSALLASLFGVAFFVRPTALGPGLLVGLYLLAVDRRGALRYAAVGALWAGAFAAYQRFALGRLPYYYAGPGLDGAGWLEALAGQLFSPGRGLLVFAPVVAFGPFLLLRYGAPRGWGGVVALAAGGVVAQLGVSTWLPEWWGGHSYGPRLACEAIPWLALLALAGLRAARTATSTRRARRLELAAGLVLLAWSIALQAAGAFSVATLRWNQSPRPLREAPERLWDWSDPPFLAWRAGRPR
jgi:hypothetical protein